MLIIGLTGGVASGKNFVASQFAKLKIPVFDADFEVHRLLAEDKIVFKKVKDDFPGAIVGSKIDRKILGEEVFEGKFKLWRLERIIYPALRKVENQFIRKNRLRGKKIILLNIPLLFEKGGYKRCDKTIAIITPKRTRFIRFKNRFAEKGDMDIRLIYKKFNNITKNQVGDLQRRKYADFIIYNGFGQNFCQSQIAKLLKNFN
ncbi:MAG: coaE [Rickettsiaceae bacterium]|jgi:dephospho-CoA kinase|nr:coaE [Rickettsiaceae bacterium]